MLLPVHRPILKRARLDNRIGLGLSLLLGLLGILLVGDWQGIGDNPCALVTAAEPTTNSNVNISTVNHSSLLPHDYVGSGSGSGSGLGLQILPDELHNTELDTSGEDPGTFEVHPEVRENIVFSTNESDNKKLCESQSTSKHKCFWNPKSRVTGEHCTTCRPVCLSTQKSINFVQFSIGIMLASSSNFLTYHFTTVVGSNIVDRHYQVRYTVTHSFLCYLQ